MKTLKKLFDNNRAWADAINARDDGFFKQLVAQQAPEYLWIGCSDSRVPANDIVGLMPGELFVHRNVANIVEHTDVNCLSVIQYAVEILKVKHIIICGHYGCGGIRAALNNKKHGLIDNWLRNIKDIYHLNENQFEGLTEDKKTDLLCELNVAEQVRSTCHTTIVQEAWDRGQTLNIHGWIYNINDGLLQNLEVCITSKDQLHPIYQTER